MEEDINILEELVELNSSKLTEYKTTGVWYNEDTERYTKCIENLIKEYRRLENDNCVLRAGMIRMSIADSIPKSKIKEKIEELVHTASSNPEDEYVLFVVIRYLEELLKENQND